MAQPPSLDHAQKLSQVDFLRVSLLWRPLREARVSLPVSTGRRRGSGPPAEAASRGSPRGRGPGGGRGRLSGIRGWPVCCTLAGQRRSRAPCAARSPEGRPARRYRKASRARRLPRAGSRVAVSVPGATFTCLGSRPRGWDAPSLPRAALGAEPGLSASRLEGAPGRGAGGVQRPGRPGRAGGAHPSRERAGQGSRHGPSSLSITRTC